jgi:stearoyl-CoA desaturase (delta-9 desaturase)
LLEPSLTLTLRAPSCPPAAPVPPPEKLLTSQRIITAFLVVTPLLALGVGMPFLWGHAIQLRDVILAVVLYTITGHGITVGFHRLFTHRSFKAKRVLKIVLAAAGSMAVEGSLIAWVANHRRHHMFSDQPGDPHSPRWPIRGNSALRGFLHAHVGWMFGTDRTSADRFAPDMLADPDAVLVTRLFPFFAICSFALPFFAGWLWSGNLVGALTALVWAGAIRMALLHHVTWSINSICHLFGRRPFATKDRSTNFAPLALMSFGESWHNAHHACPSSARHGVLPHQLDSSAALIRLFERAGWASKVRWPTADRLAQCYAG